MQQVKEVFNFNAIAYAHSKAVTAAKRRGIKSPEALAFFAEVDGLRERMRRPEGKPVRAVITATETTITALPKKKLHKGDLLSYYAQGTIADFINRAALKIIALEKSKGWRLVIPCHDSLYIVARPEHEQELAEIMLAEPAESGLQMKLKVRHWNDSRHPQLFFHSRGPLAELPRRTPAARLGLLNS